MKRDSLVERLDAWLWSHRGVEAFIGGLLFAAFLLVCAYLLLCVPEGP